MLATALLKLKAYSLKSVSAKSCYNQNGSFFLIELDGFDSGEVHFSSVHHFKFELTYCLQRSLLSDLFVLQAGADGFATNLWIIYGLAKAFVV